MRETWSVHQLVEFLAAVTDEQDEEKALLKAVELASESLDAEIGAVVVGGQLQATVGFGAMKLPCQTIQSLDAGAWLAELGDIGSVHVAVSEMLRPDDRLLVGRLGRELAAEERNLLGGMARVLGLGLRTLRNLTSERDLRSAQEQLAEERLHSMHTLLDRQQLLETLLNLQQSISHRAPLSDILAAATGGASRLLSRQVWLFLDHRRATDTDERLPDVAGVYGPTGPSRAEAEKAARAVLESGPNARSRLARNSDALDTPTSHIASTVHVGGSVSGALVAEVSGDRAWDSQDQRLLVTFAEHVSMALTDARTVAAVDEAFHDELTDLPNRALFLDRVEQALACSSGTCDEVGVLFIDLDRFKAVNDSLGHAAGDELIKQVAQRLSSSLRHNATAGRFGGDEFAVLLEQGGSIEDASVLAQRIIERLREPFRLDTSTVVIGASIGIAFGGASVRDAQDLIRNADLAMYEAKKDGRNGWMLFEHDMYVKVRERVELEAALQAAVVRRQLSLEYQPIVRLEDEVVVGAGAIVHWDHPKRGRVSSSVFVPLAEETGVIVEIGRWALDEALRQAAAWQSRHGDLRIFVHLSRRQLDEASLIEDVKSALERHHVPPEQLALTVTEKTLRGEDTTGAAQIRALKSLGVVLAVDDFTSGTSSLGYLRSLPIDVLRIDGSLVEGATDNAKQEIIARGIVQLGGALGLTSMGVGIASASHLLRLRSTACQLGQGDYFSGPLRPSAFSSLLDMGTTKRNRAGKTSPRDRSHEAQGALDELEHASPT